MIFKDRERAGQLLASKLLKYKGENAVVLALPRGGIPVAAQISKRLGIPLEVLAVRKIGAPFNPELALGAICEEVSPILSDSMLAQVGLKPEDLADIVESEKKEIKRQIQKFRNGRRLTGLLGKTVIVVDDGLATGATVTAAIKYLRTKEVAKIVVAVPVAATSSAGRIRAKADDLIVLEENENLLAVGYWYENFDPVSDHEAVSLLKKSRVNKDLKFVPSATAETAGAWRNS